VDAARQRVDELGGDAEAERATIPRIAARENACRCPISSACARLAGRRAERLASSGTSTTVQRATAHRLGQDRGGIAHVLEDVGQDGHVVVPSATGRRAPSNVAAEETPGRSGPGRPPRP
jgi:hypothetical protein